MPLAFLPGWSPPRAHIAAQSAEPGTDGNQMPLCVIHLRCWGLATWPILFPMSRTAWATGRAWGQEQVTGPRPESPQSPHGPRGRAGKTFRPGPPLHGPRKPGAGFWPGNSGPDRERGLVVRTLPVRLPQRPWRRTIELGHWLSTHSLGTKPCLSSKHGLRSHRPGSGTVVHVISAPLLPFSGRHSRSRLLSAPHSCHDTGGLRHPSLSERSQKGHILPDSVQNPQNHGD